MAYRDFVEEVAHRARPSEIILNRSPEHAAVIMERLFMDAQATVKILTGGLSDEVYGATDVKVAALDFLRERAGELSILHEREVVRGDNALLAAIDEAGLGNRVALARIPSETQQNYRFHFSVNDQQTYRFEQDRDSREATVQFGAPFAEQLEQIFKSISIAAGLAFAV